MISQVTKRPRNVTALQAAALLYGDWGTSKAYVLGLAFAIAGYASFWLILAVSVLMFFVALNYITICKYSPTGGGVYASAKKHSGVLALIGAFFLIADYLITAALSALSCFSYLEVANPEYWAIGSIIFIAFINYFGPRSTGNLAFVICVLAAGVVISLGVVSLPFLSTAVHSVEPIKGGFLQNWAAFVSIIIALSGIESIANSTGVMKLDPGSTEMNPSVHQTSKRAIILVMAEVCFFTAFLGLMMNALPGLTIVQDGVVTVDHEEVRDSMLRYMGDYFFSNHWGSAAGGHFFGSMIGIIFAVLLLSAVNSAIVALNSLMFIMSRDGEIPEVFQKLNSFGVPKFALIFAGLAPAIVLYFVNDMVSLANLYAVGFVGAVAMNIGVNAFDRTLPIKLGERMLMAATFITVVLVELTLLIDKPAARWYAIAILAFGLVLRGFVVERRQRIWAEKKVTLKHATLFTDDTKTPLHVGAIMCAVRTIGKTLDFALEESKRYQQPLYILYVREQKVITQEDKNRLWLDDEEASKIFDYAKSISADTPTKFFYAVSDSTVDTIVDYAKRLHISRLILGRPRYSAMLQMLRGNVVQEVSEVLPPDIDLLVIC